MNLNNIVIIVESWKEISPSRSHRTVSKISLQLVTDSDARAICEYATIHEVPLYTARDKNQAECLQLMRLIDIFSKQRTAFKNKLHDEETLGNYLRQCNIL